MCTMYTKVLLLLCTLTAHTIKSSKTEEPTSYYYGLEESERGLPACTERQACSVLLERYWRPAALIRLCRCGRRLRCPDTEAPHNKSIELNNRAHFKFCKPVTDWPLCSNNETSLIVKTTSDRLDPDEIEQLHHQNVHLVPPTITFKCRCRDPYYWKWNSTSADGTHNYQCHLMPSCDSGAFCGNFRYDLHSLYQSCLCPRHHICVHNGGVTYQNISELMFIGKGRKAYCQRIKLDDENDYYYII